MVFLKHTVLALFGSLLILVSACPAVAEFHPLKDISYDDGGFEAIFHDQKGGTFLVSRSVRERPVYDGPRGSSMVSAEMLKDLVSSTFKDLFQTVVPGQYRLFGFEAKNETIYAFSMGQVGAEFRILNIVVFDSGHPKGRRTGPKGGFQYGSPSPDGRYCLLVDDRIIAVDLSDGTSKIIRSGDLMNTEADPVRKSKYGGTLGGSANLTGEFLEMLWDSPRSGRLVVRGVTGKTMKEITVRLK